MKTLENIKSTIRPGKNKVGIDDNGRNEYDSKDKFDGNKVDSAEVDGSEVEDNKITKKKNHQKMSKSKKIIRSLNFFTPKPRLVLTKLR